MKYHTGLICQKTYQTNLALYYGVNPAQLALSYRCRTVWINFHFIFVQCCLQCPVPYTASGYLEIYEDVIEKLFRRRSVNICPLVLFTRRNPATVIIWVITQTASTVVLTLLEIAIFGKTHYQWLGPWLPALVRDFVNHWVTAMYNVFSWDVINSRCLVFRQRFYCCFQLVIIIWGFSDY